ncbi:MAG: hypothetical protein ACK5M4_08025 [Pseudorhodobacter sp.]
MPHDFAAQRDETFAAFAEMMVAGDLPDIADLDFFFLSDREGADPQGLSRALAALDFQCHWAPEEGELIATLPDQPLSAAAIWIAEDLSTRIALDHGFRPDGWGLEQG